MTNKNTKCPIDAHCQRHHRKDYELKNKDPIFRCSLPKAMSISRSEILRKKKRPENEKSWKVMGVQWEVIGGQRKVSGHWTVMGGQ